MFLENAGSGFQVIGRLVKIKALKRTEALISDVNIVGELVVSNAFNNREKMKVKT